jgi:hypothetical protein
MIVLSDNFHHFRGRASLRMRAPDRDIFKIIFSGCARLVIAKQDAEFMIF